ncbi:uncharacterized protein LOC124433827 isoform X2 [Xenia sp. Carnegie-2017]|uniref:uncharacterized protein LOC124433827 isoform X2 n=1 Tax=Xenia sp. Carnegie-2017 TaxID=2897299 RepID=UPI001F047AE4|nr:uncharacterized protein LOC124433827 isoform X2 [Xenia sp. Carnegie-2017]
MMSVNNWHLQSILMTSWYLQFGLAAMTGQTTAVYRNAIDSFYVGINGCKIDANVCSRFSRCQKDGSCLCTFENPSFYNDGVRYGCVANTDKRLTTIATDPPKEEKCLQVRGHIMTHNPKHRSALNTHRNSMRNCRFERALVKFPDIIRDSEQSWLNTSYVELRAQKNNVTLKWLKPVPQLKGTIVTLQFICPSTSDRTTDQCVKAKVLGAWHKASTRECANVSWRLSFDSRGWSICKNKYHFITGFRRSTARKNDPIYLLEDARCCESTQTYDNEPGVCRIANWSTSLNRNGKWSECPRGHFLSGLYRSNRSTLSSIDRGRCCRPESHPLRYGLCYDENIAKDFNRKGWSICKRVGYYITGLYRGNGKNELNNIDKFRCCQMASEKTSNSVISKTPFTYRASRNISTTTNVKG